MFIVRRGLPEELYADLTDSRITGIGHDSKVRVADVPVRIRELRMVKYVEEFCTQVESDGFCYEGPLRQTEIGIVESGTMEEAPVRSAKGSEGAVWGECARKEVAPSTIAGWRVRAVRIRGPRSHNL